MMGGTVEGGIVECNWCGAPDAEWVEEVEDYLCPDCESEAMDLAAGKAEADD